MRNTFRDIFLFIVLLYFSFASTHLSAQPTRISSSVDSTNYLIGDWIRVRISVEHSYNTFVLWSNPPRLDTTVFQKISESKIDSIQQKDFLTENRIITFTTYDTGVLRIPSLTYYFRKNGEIDSASTSSIVLFVSSVPIDTSKSFRPIKPPIIIPSTENKQWLYIISIFSLLLIAGGYWFFIRQKRKRQSEVLKQLQDTRLPHEKAFDELDELELKKLWQQGEVKQYYVRITQILREYLEAGLSIPALENTTYEIISALRKKMNDEPLLTQLKNDLTIADFVKFAKTQPSPEENIRIMNTVKEFIAKTKPVVHVQMQKEEQPV